MGKHKSIGGKKSTKIRKAIVRKAAPIYNSDEDIPDERAENYHKDDIDIYNEQLESSDDDGGLPEAKAPRKEAVYDFSDTDEDDVEEMEKRLKKIEASVRRKQKNESSDDEDSESEDDGTKAWGKKKDDFYGADIRSKVDLGLSDDDEEADARQEEKEARMLQQKLLSQVDEGDFGLDMFTAAEPSDTTAPSKEDKLPALTESVTADVSKMSEKEKLKLLKKEYPEFLNIVNDYKQQLLEYKERIGPLLDLYKRKLIPESSGIELIKRKARLVLDYCTCAQFYLLLRAEKTPVEGHPVVKRMVQFKQLLKEISSAEERFKPEIDFVLKKLAEGKEMEMKSKPETQSVKKMKKKAVKSSKKPDTAEKSVKQVQLVEEKKKTKKKPKGDEPKKSMQSLLDDTDSEAENDVESSAAAPEETETADTDLTTAGEKEALEFYNMMRKRRRAGDEEDIGEDDEGMDVDENGAAGVEQAEDPTEDKRAITSEMQKNKGLTAVRPKHLKNPRVKNKLKYQRKKKIHKSMVPQALRETNRYSGESSGIRAGRIRSVQLS